MDSDDYKCSACGGTFQKGWSDEEALAEKEQRLTEPLGQCAIVCDDCYKAIMEPELTPNGFEAHKQEISEGGPAAHSLVDMARERGIKLQVPHGNERLLRHQYKMQRKVGLGLRMFKEKYGAMFPYEEPATISPRYVWIQSQIMAQTLNGQLMITKIEEAGL